MTEDKALRKVLERQNTGKLSSGFNTTLMDRVYLESVKKKKRSFILALCGISGISLCLISLAVYLLKDHLSFSFQWPVFRLSAESKALYGFSFYIAFLVFLLIALDAYLRHKRILKKSR